MTVKELEKCDDFIRVFVHHEYIVPNITEWKDAAARAMAEDLADSVEDMIQYEYPDNVCDPYLEVPDFLCELLLEEEDDG